MALLGHSGTVVQEPLKAEGQLQTLPLPLHTEAHLWINSKSLWIPGGKLLYGAEAGQADKHVALVTKGLAVPGR